MIRILDEVFTVAVRDRDGSLVPLAYPGMTGRVVFASPGEAIAYIERYWQSVYKPYNGEREPVVVRGTL